MNIRRYSFFLEQVKILPLAPGSPFFFLLKPIAKLLVIHSLAESDCVLPCNNNLIEETWTFLIEAAKRWIAFYAAVRWTIRHGLMLLPLRLNAT